MTLYEINQEIEAAIAAMFDEVDEETGEVKPGTVELLNQLQVARDEKIENIGVYIKNLTAEAAAIKAEEKNLKARREAKENRAERLKKYLTDQLGGENWTKSAKVSLTFRTSSPVEIDDESKIPEQYMKVKTEMAPDKTAIKKAIDAGEKVPGAHIGEKKNIQIK